MPATKPDPLYPKPETESLVNCHGVPKTAGENLMRDIRKSVEAFFQRYPGVDSRHVESLAVGEVFSVCAETRVLRSTNWRKAAIQSAKNKAKKK